MKKNRRTRKDKLNLTLRAKIALEISMHPKKLHKDIADFYGVSRQLITQIAGEYDLQRCKMRGTSGSKTHPERNRTDIVSINEKFSNHSSKTIELADNLSKVIKNS